MNWRAIIDAFATGGMSLFIPERERYVKDAYDSVSKLLDVLDPEDPLTDEVLSFLDHLWREFR